MKKTEITITNQEEFNALDVKFKGKIIITGAVDTIENEYPNATIHICESAKIRVIKGSAQISDVSGSAQISDVSGSAQISYVYGSAQIRNVSGSAQISYVYGSAQISDVYGSAQIRNVSGSAQIRNVSGSAQISDVSGSAQIRNVSGSAQIRNVYGSAQIRNVYGSAQISYVYGSANVLYVDGQATVQTKGKNIVSYFNDKQVKLDTSSNSTIVVLDRFNATWEAYVSLYPVKIVGDKAILYKAVHKEGDKFISNHDRSFQYVIGETAKEKCDKNKSEDCSYGINVSHKMWAINFGRGWNDIAILELEVPISKIVVPEQCDGKVRTPEAKVIREVPLEEYYA